MSQPPYSNYFPYTYSQRQQQLSPQHQQWNQQQAIYQQQFNQQHTPQLGAIPQPQMVQPPPSLQVQTYTNDFNQHPSRNTMKEPTWFAKMCEALSSQQSIHEAGSLDRPPMLTPGNYDQWVIRFFRFCDLKKPHGKFLKKVILEGPFEMPTVIVPGDPTAVPPRDEQTNIATVADLNPTELLHYEADELAMEYILLGLPNPILRSVDAQKTAQKMWDHIRLLMEGSVLNQEDLESKIYLAYEHFMIEPGETLESYHHRFSDIINDLDKHNIIMPRIAVNTKFLSSLGPEWEKYVIFLRQAKNMHHSTYGLLYDYLKPHEKEVDRERILRAQIAPPTHPENQQLALYAQQSYPPQQATQPTASVTPNDQS